MIAVIFEADVHPQAGERYLQLASELKPLLAEIPGFISIERFQSINTPGKMLSLSWWEDEDAVLRWKCNVRHQATQQEGKQLIFSYYRIRVATVLKDYASEKGSASVYGS
ncbi:antibiotic biosynthesis monooxygenase [Citrobacter youngae]|uniref:antibiotic biosynthesis monooxygenase family protein n=1 Tax=Citrobacter youngae TaxID=133448 RepID=UPI002FCDB868